jgi:hypothetical protein
MILKALLCACSLFAVLCLLSLLVVRPRLGAVLVFFNSIAQVITDAIDFFSAVSSLFEIVAEDSQLVAFDEFFGCPFPMSLSLAPAFQNVTQNTKKPHWVSTPQETQWLGGATRR